MRWPACCSNAWPARLRIVGDGSATVRLIVQLGREPHLGRLCPAVPSSLVELVHCMLGKDPVNRPLAAQVADELSTTRRRLHAS